MDAAAIVLIAVVGLKAVEILQAVRWIASRGEEYRALLDAERPTTETERWELAERIGGDFFPTGYKDLRLRHTRVGRAFRWAVWRLGRLTAIGATYAVTSVSLSQTHPELFQFSARDSAWLIYALALALLLCALLMAIEMTVSYAMLGGYAEPFHMKRPRGPTWGAWFLNELRVVAHVAGLAITSASAGVFVAQAGLGGFGGMTRVEPASLQNLALRALDAVYFVCTTFATVGYGDIHPTNAAGKSLVVGIEAVFFVLLGVGLIALTLARSDRRDSPAG